jgi:hypothetical protein
MTEGGILNFSNDSLSFNLELFGSLVIFLPNLVKSWKVKCECEESDVTFGEPESKRRKFQMSALYGVQLYESLTFNPSFLLERAP